MKIEQEIERRARQVEGALEDYVPRRRPHGLSDAAWHHLDTGGKRIRPALCLIACEALGGEAERALPFAVGVELLHNMLLVHDDIEDGDTVRRNKPTLWKAYGVANAINVGDYLLARAFAAVLRSPVEEALRGRLLEVFTATYERTVEGQALDINARSQEDFTVEDYLRMAMLKTGQPLSELATLMEVFPQKLVNVDVSRKPDIATVPEIVAAIRRVEEELKDEGRVLVRYSGTQSMCRVMVEGPTEEATARYCDLVAGVVRDTIG